MAEPDISYHSGTAKADHLCVLVHGLWGSPVHMTSIAEALRAEHSKDRLHLLVAKTNSGTFTYDGIETGGERVCTEIEDELASIKERGGHITRISIIGYSLGGLVARYTVGLLHSKGILDQLECMNFTAFASPFLGARSPRNGVTNTVWNALGGRILSMSGRQLFGIDSFRDTGRPLLAILADPDSVFMAGLARFQRRTLYANIVNDMTATHYTTAITKSDPYGAFRADDVHGGEIEDLPLKFVPGYDNIILDRDEPVDWQKLDETWASAIEAPAEELADEQAEGQDLLEPNGQGGKAAKDTKDTRERNGGRGRKDVTPSPQRQQLVKKPRASQTQKLFQALLTSPWSPESRKTLRDAAPFVAMALLLPLGVTAFLAHSAYETVRSRRRRQLHDGGLAGIDVSQYRGSLWLEGLQKTADETFETLDSAHAPDHLAYGDSESGSESSRSRSRSESGSRSRSRSQNRDGPSQPNGYSNDDDSDDNEAARLEAQLIHESQNQTRPDVAAEPASKCHHRRLQHHHRHHRHHRLRRHSTDSAASSASSASVSTRSSLLEPPSVRYQQTLALSHDQFAMVKGLDSLGWRKYHVWIHKVRHSHAAIIYRRQEPGYDEGTIVLRHFLTEEFLI